MATDPTQLHQLSLLLQSKRRDAESKERGRDVERKGVRAAAFVFRECREQSLSFRFKVRRSILFIVVVFLSVGLVEPVRFGSIQSVSEFENRTELNFLWFFNQLIQFFRFGFFDYFFGFFSLIGLSVFLVTPKSALDIKDIKMYFFYSIFIKL